VKPALKKLLPGGVEDLPATLGFFPCPSFCGTQNSSPSLLEADSESVTD